MLKTIGLVILGNIIGHILIHTYYRIMDKREKAKRQKAVAELQKTVDRVFGE